uniref:Uncharacterized protein n=1 Tax=Vespula pensylvanica TaxID=30213 RepID=A0A834NSF9_VESPE|nr:hypothetical protein H0235_011633 [Vespula pensylvanica]
MDSKMVLEGSYCNEISYPSKGESYFDGNVITQGVSVGVGVGASASMGVGVDGWMKLQQGPGVEKRDITSDVVPREPKINSTRPPEAKTKSSG